MGTRAMLERTDLAALVERYRPAVLAVTLDRTGDPEVARDLAQDTLEAALRHLGELRDPEALPAWLRAITVNCCRQHARRRREDTVGLLPAAVVETESTHRAAVQREMLRQVLRALRTLPENSRLALVMHAVHGVPYAEIAAFLGVPLTTIEGRIHRARRALRREMARWLTEADHE